MKRNILFCVLIHLLAFVTAEKFALKDNFKKLSKEECFQYEYLDDSIEIDNCFYNLRVNIIKKNTKCITESLYFNSLYGETKISENGRILIAAGGDEVGDYTYNYYKIDGESGTVSLIGVFYPGLMVDKTCSYYTKQHFGEDSDTVVFDVYEIITNKKVRTFTWKIKDRIGGACVVFRSENPDYDFMIDYCVEIFYYGRLFYNIKRNEIFEEFNDSDTSREIERCVKHTLYENGLIPKPENKIKKIR